MKFSARQRCILGFFSFSVLIGFLAPLYQEITSSTIIWTSPLEFLRPRRPQPEAFDLATLENLYKERRDNARIECRNHPIKSTLPETKMSIKNSFYDPNTNSLYCAVPKIGSSLWKRFFLLAHQNQTKDPLSISGLKIHLVSSLAKLSLAKIPEEKRPETVKQAFTFMFARNPFHRVFSAYCDKLFMLAYETSRIGRHIRQAVQEEWNLRRGMVAANTTVLDGSFYTGPEMNITFAEALAHATSSGDPHFMKISRQCNPCDIDFNVLGRIESIETDSRYILTKLNRSHILQNTMDGDDFKDSRDQGIINELLQRVFQILQGKPVGTTRYKALVRTWKVFHIRGLVKDDIPYPLSPAETEKVNQSRIAGMAVEAMHRSGTPSERLAQREKYYRQAFRSVPLAGILSFSRSVSSDCRLFGYDCYPADIFHGRKDGDEIGSIFSNDKYIYDGFL